MIQSMLCLNHHDQSNSNFCRVIHTMTFEHNVPLPGLGWQVTKQLRYVSTGGSEKC